MKEKSYTWWPSDRVVIRVNVANELWYNTLANGERHIHLFNAGWYECNDCHGVRLWSVTILWLLVRVGIVR